MPKIRDYFQSFGKGCQITRRDEFLKEVGDTQPGPTPGYTVYYFRILTHAHNAQTKGTKMGHYS